MEYKTIGTQQKVNMLVERLNRLETEHYQHDVNVTLCRQGQKAGDKSDETKAALAQSRGAMQSIEQAAELVTAELKKLGVDPSEFLHPPEGQEPPEGNRATRRAKGKRGGKATRKSPTDAAKNPQPL